MIERPVLFVGSMVMAILEGRKTQTRRIVKPLPPLLGHQARIVDSIECEWLFANVEPNRQRYGFWIDDQYWKCPYGGPGDQLWVREATRAACWGTVETPEHAMYDADGEWVLDVDNPCRWFGQRSYKPPMHMPRGWCRIFLSVKAVRVERLQEIDWLDAIAEGCKDPRRCSIRVGKNDPKSPVNQFMTLWDSINAKRGYSWESNPFVWVVEFEKLASHK